MTCLSAKLAHLKLQMVILIFITQRDGMFYAYQNLCPHLQVELEFLENQFLDRDQEFIECSTHGALFMVESGECISGPCQGQSLEKVRD